jgi:hypothetical protein
LTALSVRATPAMRVSCQGLHPMALNITCGGSGGAGQARRLDRAAAPFVLRLAVVGAGVGQLRKGSHAPESFKNIAAVAPLHPLRAAARAGYVMIGDGEHCFEICVSSPMEPSERHLRAV